MQDTDSGYWDFYEDDAGYWHWRFACTEFERVMASARRYASSEDCFHDAMQYGYSRFSERRVTPSISS